MNPKFTPKNVPFTREFKVIIILYNVYIDTEYIHLLFLGLCPVNKNPFNYFTHVDYGGVACNVYYFVKGKIIIVFITLETDFCIEYIVRNQTKNCSAFQICPKEGHRVCNKLCVHHLKCSSEI